MASRMVNLILRGLEFFFTLVIMAIVGNMIASAIRGNPSLINYDMFVVVFGMLSLFYLIATAFNDSFTGHPIIPLALDAINTFLYFCAAVAMAAELGTHSCNNINYTKSNHITNGANDTAGRCREAQAATAFLWFAFICFVVSLVFSVFNARGGGVNLRSSGIRKGGPVMSQV